MSLHTMCECHLGETSAQCMQSAWQWNHRPLCCRSKRKAKTCKSQDLKEGLIRNRIVCSIQYDKTCSRLLKEPDFTLQNAINICRANEATAKQMKSFANSTADEATDIHHIYNNRQLCERGSTGHNKKQLSPAVGATSHKCRCKNYFAKMCHSKTRPLYGIQTEEDGQTSSDMIIGTMQKNQNTRE